MKRIAFSIFATLTLVAAARAETVQVRGQEKPIVGTMASEDAKAVVVNAAGGKKITIPAADVIDIYYENVRPFALTFPKGAYRDAREAEKEADDGATPDARKAALAKAITKYQDALKTVERTTAKTQIYAIRHFEYKVALLTLKQARAEITTSAKAIAALNSFKSRFPNSWQINFIMPTLARLHEDGMDFEKAAAVFQEMSEMDGFPPAVRQDAEIRVVETLVRSGDIAKANQQLDALAKKAAGNPGFASRIQMARAGVLVSQKKIDEAIPILKKVVKENSDRDVKAIAHNTLGECLFKAQKFNEALWEFVWVDAVFNQDARQHAKALYYLAETFDRLNNAERAQECREMLRTDRRFAGTEYQRMLASQSK